MKYSTRWCAIYMFLAEDGEINLPRRQCVFATIILACYLRNWGKMCTRKAVYVHQHWDTFVQPLSQWQNNKYYVLWVCVCSLGNTACKEHAQYYIVICGVSVSTIFFPHYLINGTIFGKKVIEHKICIFIFFRTFVWNISLHLLFERFLILGRTEISKLYTGLHIKYPFLFSDFNETWIFSWWLVDRAS